jgi:hypothetical protein
MLHNLKRIIGFEIIFPFQAEIVCDSGELNPQASQSDSNASMTISLRSFEMVPECKSTYCVLIPEGGN